MLVSFRFTLASITLLLVPSLLAQSTTPANPALRSLFLVGNFAPTSASDIEAVSPGSLAGLFDATKLNLVNRTSPGHSSRTYITSGEWAATLALLKPEDVVLVQFSAHDADPLTNSLPGQPSGNSSLPGLNDDFREVTNPTTHQREIVHSYGWYLRQIVVDSIAHGATPILCSPLSGSTAQAAARSTPQDYSGWARSIATQQRIAFLDLLAIVKQQGSEPVSTDNNATAIIAALKGLHPNPLAGFFSPQGATIPAAAPPPPPPPVAPSSLELPAPPTD